MQTSPPFRAVIFDMDGLMIDSERVVRDAWRRAASDLSYQIFDKFYLQLIGRRAEDSERAFKAHFGGDFPYQTVRLRKLEYEERHFAKHGVAKKPGIGELLDFLDAHGIARAVATSAKRVDAELKLTRANLITRFRSIVTSDDVVHGKPAPEPFLKAARLLGMQASECLVLEDSEAGIQGAAAADMRAIMVPDLKAPSPETARLAYRICSSLHEVAQFLSVCETVALPSLSPVTLPHIQPESSTR